jgi:hypothetical protein
LIQAIYIEMVFCKESMSVPFSSFPWILASPESGQEVDPKEEASVVEVFQDVLDKLSDVGKKDKLLKFFKLVQDGKYPLNTIAFELVLDIVEWFDKDESRQIGNSPSRSFRHI